MRRPTCVSVRLIFLFGTGDASEGMRKLGVQAMGVRLEELKIIF